MMTCSSTRDARIERLTARERDILEYAALGKGNDAIALELGIAAPTVAKHLEHVYRKLGVPNRTAAAALLDTPAVAGRRDRRWSAVASA